MVWICGILEVCKVIGACQPVILELILIFDIIEVKGLGLFEYESKQIFQMKLVLAH